jgi:hypothetical protein
VTRAELQHDKVEHTKGRHKRFDDCKRCSKTNPDQVRVTEIIIGLLTEEGLELTAVDNAGTMTLNDK